MMKWHGNKVSRRSLALILAVMMLVTTASSALALEPLVNLQLVVSGEDENTSPDSSSAEAPEVSTSSSEDEQAPEQNDEQSSSSLENLDSSFPEDPEDDPPVSSGEDVAPPEEQIPAEEIGTENSGLDPPDSASFEAFLDSGFAMRSRAANARESLYINMKTVPEYSFKYPFGGGASTFAFYVYWTSDGQTAYCIEPARFDSNHGTAITGSMTWSGLSMEKQQAIARVMAANTAGHSDFASYAAAQVLIWEIAMGQKHKSGSVYQAIIVPHASELASKYDSLLTKYQNMGEIPSFMSRDKANPTVYTMTEEGGQYSIDLKNSNSKVRLEEDAFKSQAQLDFSVSGSTLTVSSAEKPGKDSFVTWESQPNQSGLIFWNSSEQTKASATEPSNPPVNGYMSFSSEAVSPEVPDEGDEPQQVGYLTIYKYDGETNFPLGGAVFKLECEGFRDDAFPVPYGGATAVIPIPKGKTSVDVQVTEITAPNGYQKSNETKTVTVTANNISNVAEVGFTNYPLECSLTIYKHAKGDKSVALEGARFRIRYADPDVSAQVWTETTDSSGRISIDLPSSGTLIVEELEAPSGYVIGEISSHEVVVQKGEDKQIDISNDKKADIIVYKKDNQTGQLLQGAVIKATLLRSHTEPYESGMVYTRTTDSDGRAVFESMVPGEYRIEETSPPQFYLPTDVVHTVNVIDGSHEPVELEFRNDPWTGLTIRKVDATDGKGLEGAVFKLYEGTAAETTKFLGDFQSNENGMVTITELESNQYYTVVEAQPPYGYFLDDEHNVQTILIKPEAINENITIIFRNMPKPKLLIQKIDADTGLPLAGAVFRVSRRSTAEYVDVTTGPDGTYLLENMEEDWYEVFELRAPTNYVTDDTHYDIELIAGETAKLVVKNRKKPTLTIEKLDSMTLQPLEGVVFDISLKNGKSLGEFSTGPDGKIVLEHVEPNQIYLMQEKRCLPGYLLDETVHELRLDENESGVLKLKNTPEHPLIIQKRDEVTGEPIPDTDFLVTHSDGRLVGEYRTGKNGMATVAGDDVVPGWYLVKETRPNPAYIASSETKLVELKYEAPAVVEFVNTPRTGLQIRKVDSVTGAPIPDVGFYIEEIGGRTIGTYYTDDAGIINLPDQEEIWVQVTEIKPAAGYQPDPTPRTIQLESGKLNILEFRNQPYPTLKIIKRDADTRQPMEGVKIRVYDKFHREVGTFTTNRLGQILLSGVDGGETLYLQEVETLPGYQLDETVHEVTLAWGQTSTVELINKPLSNLRLIKIDSETKEPIYGTMFHLYDAKNNLLGEYVTDQRGIIEFPRELAAGKYKLKEIRCEGYVVDSTIRTIELKSGETTELTVENRPLRGRIQIIKKAADNNPITKDKAGDLLENAEFTIYDDKLEVVDTITTGSDGVATSKPLPLATYAIKETASPEYYLTDGKVFYATLKIADDLVRFEVQNQPADVNVTVEKRGNVEVLAGDIMQYDFSEIGNASNVELEEFYWHDKLPAEVRLGKIVTGTWSERLDYAVKYKTNIKNRWKTLEDDLSTRTSHTLDCSREALKLAAGEYVTDIRFEFGTVGPDFHEEKGPVFYVSTLGDLADGYRIINRTDVGGRIEDEWIVDKDTWITVVWGKPKGDLPKTGV